MEPIVITKENFEAEVVASPLPVLLDFWAGWCGPCRMLAPTVDALCEKYAGRVKVGKVDVDAQQELAAVFGVASIPTLLLFRGGQLVTSSVGVQSAAALEQMLEQVL